MSPLLQGRVYMGLAEAHSSMVQQYEAHSSYAQEQECQALNFLERSYNTFPDHPKDDPNFAYTHFQLPRGYVGLIYLNLNQPSKAWEAFEQKDKTIPTA